MLEVKTVPIECECKCKEGRFGYVYAAFTDIHLCPPAFNSDKELAITIIHEMTHKWAETQDYAYINMANKGRVAFEPGKDSPKHLLAEGNVAFKKDPKPGLLQDNADSIAWFIYQYYK